MVHLLGPDGRELDDSMDKDNIEIPPGGLVALSKRKLIRLAAHVIGANHQLATLAQAQGTALGNIQLTLREEIKRLQRRPILLPADKRLVTCMEGIVRMCGRSSDFTTEPNSTPATQSEEEPHEHDEDPIRD